MKKIILVLAILLCTSCHSAAKLPRGSEVLENYGKGWYKFSLDGNTFLYHHSANGYFNYECMAFIEEG